MSQKIVLIPAICFFLLVTITFLGCSFFDFPNYVIQHYPFDGHKDICPPDDPELNENIAEFTEAIEDNPESVQAYYARALAYSLKGEYDKAIADYTKLIELKPEYAPAYNMRGCAYYDKGEYDKAISDCNKAIEIETEPKYDAAYYYNLGFYYDSMREYDKAIDGYTKAIEVYSNCWVAYYRRGLVYEAKGEYDKAASDFEKVIQSTKRTYDIRPTDAARQALERIGK